MKVWPNSSMFRILGFILLFLLALTVEISFVHVLPNPLNHLPFVLIVAVYLYQYIGYTKSVWWFVFQGIFLDLFSLTPIGFEMISALLASGILVLVSRRLFTNRSFYGLTAAVLSVVLVHRLSLMVFASLASFFGEMHLYYRVFAIETLWTGGLTILFLLMVFPFAKRIRLILHEMMLI
jgi:hypothetical protein